MFSLFLLFVLVIGASALCSMSEAAILSLPMIRARVLFEQKIKNSKDLLLLKEDISHTIAAIVVLNNAINIVGSIFIGQQVSYAFGSRYLGIAVTVLTISIIVASEIIPKTIGERYKTRISLLVAKPMRMVVWLLKPFVVLVINSTRLFVSQPHVPKVTEEEIKMMLKLGRAEGTVEMDEEVLCNRVFKLNDVRAYQIMKPINRIFALQADNNLKELRDEIINSKYSRIAVYNKDPLDIVGMVQQRILLREIARDNYTSKIRDFMTEPIFVNDQTKADALLEKFQAFHQHLFIVQDKDDNDVGLVTMEDVLEELFGEIYDEKDVVIPRKVYTSKNIKKGE